MLEDESINTADHDNGVHRHEQRGHGPAQPEAAVKNDERDREEREPDVSAQPPLDRHRPPERNFFRRLRSAAKTKIPSEIAPNASPSGVPPTV